MGGSAVTSSLSDAEVREVLTLHPYLKFVTENGVGRFRGVIHFNHEYDSYIIEDSFEVEITIPKGYPAEIPVARVAQERRDEISEKQKDRMENILDLHCYANGDACLGAPEELRGKFPVGAPLRVFFDELLIPFLYGLSFFEKHSKWPWGERSHGALGLLESYADVSQGTKAEAERTVRRLKGAPNWKQIGKYLRKVKKRRDCLCSMQQRSFERCHSLAWRGLLKLQSDVIRHKINIDAI